MNGILLRQAQRNAASATFKAHSHDPLIFDLNIRKVVAFDGDNRGRTLCCRHGAVWITIAGASADYLLQRGQRLVVMHKGRIVAQGMPAGVLEYR